MDELPELAERRAASLGSLLYEALRVDLARFVGRQIEDRLRARPQFAAQLDGDAFAALRAAWVRSVDELVESAGVPVTELRDFLLDQPKDELLEGEALTLGVGRVVVAATAALLAAHRFPTDEEATSGSDGYRLGYAPSAEVLWAWREVRAYDRVQVWLRRGGDPPLPAPRLRYLMPELDPGTMKREPRS